MISLKKVLTLLGISTLKIEIFPSDLELEVRETSDQETRQIVFY